jgi:hypothetical protein
MAIPAIPKISKPVIIVGRRPNLSPMPPPIGINTIDGATKAEMNNPIASEDVLKGEINESKMVEIGVIPRMMINWVTNKILKGVSDRIQ